SCARIRLRTHEERDPVVNAWFLESEAGGHHADDRSRGALYADLSVENVRIAAESPLPEAVTDDDDRVRRVRTAFGIGEHAAELRFDAVRGQPSWCHELTEDALGRRTRLVAGDIARPFDRRIDDLE